MHLKAIFSAFFIVFSFLVFGQEYIRGLDIPVSEYGTELYNPWVGGMNYLQYSKIELNGDDQEDLFVFDKSTDVFMTYINMGSEAGEMNYKYDPSYEAVFPEGLEDWVLLRDYNCDGLKDVFTYASGGIRVFEQTIDDDGVISFHPVYEFLLHATYEFEEGSAYNSPVYGSSVDLPHIGDIDNDGDVDIIAFSSGSLLVNYFINNASDEGRCDTLSLSLGNNCYGAISESGENNTIYLGESCSLNVINPRMLEWNQEEMDREESENNRDGLHTGGTLLSLETNGDGRLELILGDITNDSLIMLTNSENSLGIDSMVAQAPDFPANISATEKINFFEFPAVFNEDFDNDGIRDLVASSFSRESSIDDSSSWLYLNVGSNDFPDFALQKKDWLQDEMIEHGTNSMPVITDYNGDGLGDLVVGHLKTVKDAVTFSSSLRLYENTGTAELPEFTLVSEDWLGLNMLNLKSLHPTFGDLDNDGDLDMVLGESTGKVHYFENSAGVGEEMDLTLVEPSIQDNTGEDLDPGQDVTPQLLDVNEDGLLDIVMGELNGNLSYYKNVGTPESYSFEVTSVEFGGVWVDNFLPTNGNSNQHMYKNSDDEWEMLIGNDLGTVHKYSNISGNLDGEFTRIEQSVSDINIGRYSSPFLYDINNDGYLDLFLGNARGGVAFYYGQFYDNVIEIAENRNNIRLYPNPSTALVNIDFDLAPEVLMISDASGKEVRRVVSPSVHHQMDLSDLNSGIYFISGVYDHTRVHLGRVVKK